MSNLKVPSKINKSVCSLIIFSELLRVELHGFLFFLHDVKFFENLTGIGKLYVISECNDCVVNHDILPRDQIFYFSSFSKPIKVLQKSRNFLEWTSQHPIHINNLVQSFDFRTGLCRQKSKNNQMLNRCSW